MAAPENRVPVRIARGTKATLDTNIADLYEGEIVYATDEDSLYMLEGGALVLAGAPGGGSETLAGLTDTSIGTYAGNTTYVNDATPDDSAGQWYMQTGTDYITYNNAQSGPGKMGDLQVGDQVTITYGDASSEVVEIEASEVDNSAGSKFIRFVTAPTAVITSGGISLSAPGRFGASTGDLLSWNGSAWAPSTPAAATLDELTDVTTSVTSGTVLGRFATYTANPPAANGEWRAESYNEFRLFFTDSDGVDIEAAFTALPSSGSIWFVPDGDFGNVTEVTYGGKTNQTTYARFTSTNVDNAINTYSELVVYTTLPAQSAPATGAVLKYAAGSSLWQSGSLDTPDLGDTGYGTENVSRTWPTHAAGPFVAANEWYLDTTQIIFHETALEGTGDTTFYSQLGNDLITVTDSAGQTWTLTSGNLTSDLSGAGATRRFFFTITDRTGAEHMDTLLDTTGPLTISYYGWGTNQALTEYKDAQLFQYDSTSSSFKAISLEQANVNALALKQKPHLAHFDVAGDPPNVDDSAVPGAGRMYWTNGSNTATSSNVEATQAKFGTNSLNVNGANGGYYILTGPVGEQWSFDCWVWPAATQTVNDFPRLLQNYHFVLAMNLGVGVDRVYFQTYQGGVLAEEISGASLAITKDAWNHVALQKDGDVFTLWVNGTWEGRIIDPNAQQACGKWAIGNSVSEGNNLTGYLDEVRFTHTGAYAAEARAFENITVPTVPYTSV